MESAFIERARAVRDALAAFKQRSDGGMRLEALEFFVRREIRVLVVQMNDEADGDQVVSVVIEERAAAGCIVERPAEGMLCKTGLVFLRIDLPKLFQSDAEFRRLGILVEREAVDQRLGQAAARAFGEQRVFGAQLHAAGEGVFRLALAVDAHVAGGNAKDLAALAVQHLGRGEAQRAHAEGVGEVPLGVDLVGVRVEARGHLHAIPDVVLLLVAIGGADRHALEPLQERVVQWRAELQGIS